MNNIWIRILCGAVAVGLYGWQMIAPGPAAGSGEDMSPERMTSIVQKVKALIDEKRYEDALEPAKTLYAAVPENYIYIERLATVYHYLGKPAEEAEMWQRFLDVAPLPVEACPHLDHAYLALHDLKRQMDTAGRCLELEPDNPDLIFTQGHAWEMAGGFAKAEGYYERGFRLAPQDSDIEIGLARVRLHQGKTREALAAAERIAQRSPRNPDAYLVLGMSLFQSSQPARARAALEKGLSLAGNYTDIRILLARVAESEHENTTALAQYRRVLDLDPGNQEARHAMQRLER